MATKATKAKEVSVEKRKAAPAASPALFSEHPLQSLREEIDGAIDRLWRSWQDWSPFANDEPALEPFRAWQRMPLLRDIGIAPRADFTETEDAYKISLELPGLESGDVEITLTDDLLTVKGEKRSEHEEKKEDYHLVERRYGSFRRSFRLPGDIDDAKIKAEFEKGVLNVEAPKTAEAKKKQRKIAVKSK